MLVLTRRLGERIHIGENVVVTVIEIDRGKVRLGIEAPRDVGIRRNELVDCHEAGGTNGEGKPNG